VLVLRTETVGAVERGIGEILGNGKLEEVEKHLILESVSIGKPGLSQWKGSIFPRVIKSSERVSASEC
jgi:hypothetical protein